MTLRNLLTEVAPGYSAGCGLAQEHVESCARLPQDGLRLAVPPGTDYFLDPAGEPVKKPGPYIWRAVSGDFIARLHVRPTFAGMYDAGGILIRHDESQWAKLCFESTNFGTTAIISVVTQERSDDANGADLTVPDVWLQICRVGDVFGMHYAMDGVHWRKVRRFRLPLPPGVQVGLIGQSPGSSGTTVDFMWFSIEARSVTNTRSGA